MPATASRSAEYADRFEAAQDEFIRLLEPLTGEQWNRTGQNYPQRINDEDENDDEEQIGAVQSSSLNPRPDQPSQGK